jgi:hypothetical protein
MNSSLIQFSEGIRRLQLIHHGCRQAFLFYLRPSRICKPAQIVLAHRCERRYDNAGKLLQIFEGALWIKVYVMNLCFDFSRRQTQQVRSEANITFAANSSGIDARSLEITDLV